MSNHTPGPWRTFTSECRQITWIRDNEENNLFESLTTIFDERLIAAAPEILEALEILIKAEEATIDGFEAKQIDDLEKALNVAKQALAKAKGQEVPK